MTIDSDIRDQAYQFFIQEAPELLQQIEEDLLSLRHERSTAKIHNMMRAAHSIKGGAASVGLETIKTLAHSLEDIFKGLHNEELEIDAAVESLLLEAYDCLRLPLVEQISTGQFDVDQAMATAEPVFAKIEAQIGEFLREAELPSSVELGIDIALSIFEVDIAQGLERLSAVLAQPQGQEIAGELRAQADVFAGIAELLNLPGFGAICSCALAALDARPGQALRITQLALADFEAGRQAVIAGDRTGGGNPSQALAALAGINHNCDAESEPAIPLSLDDVFGDLGANIEPATTESSTPLLASDALSTIVDSQDPTPTLDWQFFNVELLETPTDEQPVTIAEESAATAQENIIPSLDDVFGAVEVLAIVAEEPAATVQESAIPSLDDVFGAVEVLATVTEEPVAAVQENVPPSVDDVFGNLNFPSAVESNFNVLAHTSQKSEPTLKFNAANSNGTESVQEIVQSVEQVFTNLPPIEGISTPTTEQSAALVPAARNLPSVPEKGAMVSAANKLSTTPQKPEANTTSGAPTAQLSVRVDLERLERMNNVVGELAINRNSLALQNEQLQAIVQELLRRFAKFQQLGHQLRDFSDQLLIAPERYSMGGANNKAKEESLAPYSPGETPSLLAPSLAEFDSLEMDSYGELHSVVQTTLEEMMQLEETVGDVVLLAGQSSQTLDRQRQMLGHLRDDLMWARMLPLSEVLNRFPRMLRDLSNSYQKPVELKLSGTGVLVDKAVLEKLNDPLVHLVRNAFDHGIEPPDVRRQQGKPEQGLIEIRAYHQGSQTIIEVRDDGRGVNLERIRTKALDMKLITPEQAATTEPSQLLELLFEPGFSTASQVSQLSGRGVGLDVVRAQLRSLKGSVTLTSEPGRGTIFTLRIPLTLTIAKLLVCFVGSTAFAFPSDSIAEILIPESDQMKLSGGKRFLQWQEQIVPVYHMSHLLHYASPLPETQPSQALTAVATPDDWAEPILLLEHEDQLLALEIERLVTEQELVIKPFGTAIASPSYMYGCTILGDGCLIPVIDTAGLLSFFFGETSEGSGGVTAAASLPVVHLQEDPASSSFTALPSRTSVPTILVVDDSITVRQTLALTLQKADYRVLQARDGREGISQLQQNSNIQLVISDVEMPNMNGFEFLSHHRQDPQLSKIPIVMLTSRSSEKHRQLAMHLGAKHYFTKPYIEQEFLAAIKNILTQGAPLLVNS